MRRIAALLMLLLTATTAQAGIKLEEFSPVIGPAVGILVTGVAVAVFGAIISSIRTDRTRQPRRRHEE